jgi:hypothetical protein
MMATLAELLLHPLRWRIAQAFVGRSLTTGELHEALPDVPTTSLYRQVGLLVDAGVLRVVETHRVRGTTERTYALETPAPEGPVDAAQLRTMFTVFVAGLAGDMDRYLDRPGIDPERDGIALRQAALLLTDDEIGDLGARLAEALAPYLDREPAPGRRRRILSTMLLPTD